MTTESSTLLSMRLENFKSWKDTGAIALRPLTAFFGPNHSGKSSLLQALLLLKQTVESRDVGIPLRTRVDKDGYVDLGSVSNLIHHQAQHTQINLKWRTAWPVAISDDELDLALHTLRFSVKINRSAHVEHLEYSGDEEGKQLLVRLTRQSESAYLLNARLNGQDLDRLPRKAFPSPIKCYGFPDEVLRAYYKAELFRELSLAFEKLCEDILYLGPLREHPQRVYTWLGENPRDVGIKGELAIPVLIAAGKQPVYPGRGKTTTLLRKVEEALGKLGLAQSLTIRPLDASNAHYEVQASRLKDNPSLSIADLGFGVSQVLPVLVLCYYAPPGATVILEQPEIHLHPSAQAGLADVFIDVINNRHLKLIIESHSEHFLRRIIAEGAIAPEDTAIYFCDLGEDGSSRLEELPINRYGDIGNWPKGFFGDITDDLLAAAKAGLRQANGMSY